MVREETSEMTASWQPVFRQLQTPCLVGISHAVSRPSSILDAAFTVSTFNSPGFIFHPETSSYLSSSIFSQRTSSILGDVVKDVSWQPSPRSLFELKILFWTQLERVRQTCWKVTGHRNAVSGSGRRASC